MKYEILINNISEYFNGLVQITTGNFGDKPQIVQLADPAAHCVENHHRSPTKPRKLTDIVIAFLHQNICLTIPMPRETIYRDYSSQTQVIKKLCLPRELKIKLITAAKLCKTHGGTSYCSDRDHTNNHCFILPNSPLHTMMRTKPNISETELDRYYTRNQLMKYIRGALFTDLHLELLTIDSLADLCAKSIRFTKISL